MKSSPSARAREVPVSTCTLPPGSTRTVADSHGPKPQISTNVLSPIPRYRPCARAAACSRRSFG